MPWRAGDAQIGKHGGSDPGGFKNRNRRGARITFDASSDFAWTADKTLVFSGTMGRKSVRIGTSAAALTAEQLAAVKFRTASGKLRPMTIDGDGYLMGPSKGVAISVR